MNEKVFLVAETIDGYRDFLIESKYIVSSVQDLNELEKVMVQEGNYLEGYENIKISNYKVLEKYKGEGSPVYLFFYRSVASDNLEKRELVVPNGVFDVNVLVDVKVEIARSINEEINVLIPSEDITILDWKFLRKDEETNS